MRRLAAGWMAGLMVLAATSANAGWRPGPPVTGTPNDVLDVWERGTFSVGYGQGAYLFVEDAPPRKLTLNVSLPSVGTYYQELAGCFVTFFSDSPGERRSIGWDGTSACSLGRDTALLAPNAPFVLRVRHMQGGAAAVSYGNEGGVVFLSDTSIYDNKPFTHVLGVQEELIGSLGMVRVGGRTYALVGTNSNKAQVHWVDSDKRTTNQLQDAVPSVGIAQTIDLFAAGSPALPHAVVGTQSAILQGALRDIDSPLLRSDIRPVWRFDPGTGQGVTGVSMNVDAANTSAYGHGFGMAVVGLANGQYAVASPVPMPDATRAGTRWKFRTLPSDMTLSPLNQVACTGANYCVVTATKANVGNVFVYSNDARPQFPSGALVELDEGTSGVFSFEATDPDGDPVLTLAATPSQGGASWSAKQADVGAGGGAWEPGDPVVMNVTAGNVCATQEVGVLELRASDGWAAHDVDQDILVRVRHTRRPDVPEVSFSKGELRAGEQEPLVVQVREPYAGCELERFHWSARPASTGLVGPSLATDGSSAATLTAPPTLCVAGGADFPFELAVEDGSGLRSADSRVFQVHVAPWGRPNAAFETSDGGVITAGQSRELSPSGKVHECLGTAGFPGVETTWRVTSDRALSEGGITLLDSSGNPVELGAEVRSPRLQAKTTDCVETTHLTFTAVNHLKGAADDVAGPTSVQHVTVETSLTPFDSGQLELGIHDVSEPSGELRVDVGSNLNCPARRGLRADLQISQPGTGGRSVSGQVPIQDTWEVSLGEQCLGGRLQLKASMVDDAGRRSPETVTELVAPPVRAGVEPLPADTALVAACGHNASTTLTPTFPKGFCQSPDVTWRQVSGPELTQSTMPDGTVSLVTKETGLDTLVGRSVVVEVTASAGPESQSTLQQTLPITVVPFVKVSRRAEVPAASDTGLVGVSVDLTNSTECDVNDVSYEERLEGLTYVEGSAQVQGQESGVEVAWNEGVLSVKGLSLAGKGTRRLTYVARPHLVGTRRMEGVARLRDATISISDKPGPRVDVSGCGCTSSGPGPVLLALGALVAAVRRRRR
ncbi:MYXO-CTERM sorting domain-containing protein [Archangium lipolyticum]|uniref:MYXO-CTERM sorting domain-containing protein n=1 Tax=Archangium lipolyticum TaxID=2970465 RepID=UPI002149E6A1|nr:MYXO-CTERM sorting domain-containing protein [Archangium lipolyticum]